MLGKRPNCPRSEYVDELDKYLASDEVDTNMFPETKNPYNKKKWLPLAQNTAFLIGNQCCNIMKKRPMASYTSQTKSYQYIGTMAVESRLRKQAWIRHGCNAFEGSKKTSQPLSFWTEQDVLAYIKRYDVDICSVYGDIEETELLDGSSIYENTGYSRTGCIFCAYGVHLEKGETRFQKLKKTHPKQYDYCMRGGEWVDNPNYDETVSSEPNKLGWVEWNPKKIFVPDSNGLGMATVFDKCNEIYGNNFIRYE